MEQVKTNDSVWIEFHTPLGNITKQASVITELRTTESCSYTRYNVMLDDRVVSISLAMFAANDDLKLQNMASKEMERFYNREDGRYVVKDMTLYCIHFYANDFARLEFTWIDCYGLQRGYYGHDCKIRYVDGKSILEPNRPRFYF
jgi:hypothetical protein